MDRGRLARCFLFMPSTLKSRGTDYICVGKRVLSFP